MTIIAPRLLSHDQRARLLTGHTTTLILPLSTTPVPHTIPNLPRRMLFAFSHVAAAQLTVANGVAPSPNASTSTAASTVTLPTDACTPASLAYVLFWMKQSCSLPATAPLEPLPSLRGTLGVYAAVVALGVLDAEKELYRHVMVSIRQAPLSLEQLRALVEVSGVQGPFVREALRRSAGWARRGKAEELVEAKAWLMQERPELWDVWREFDRKVEEGRMVSTKWVCDTIQGEIGRLEVEGGEKTKERGRSKVEDRRMMKEKIKEVEEKLQRQRRLAGLIE